MPTAYKFVRPDGRPWMCGSSNLRYEPGAIVIAGNVDATGGIYAFQTREKAQQEAPRGATVVELHYEDEDVIERRGEWLVRLRRAVGGGEPVAGSPSEYRDMQPRELVAHRAAAKRADAVRMGLREAPRRGTDDPVDRLVLHRLRD